MLDLILSTGREIASSAAFHLVTRELILEAKGPNKSATCRLVFLANDRLPEHSINP